LNLIREMMDKRSNISFNEINYNPFANAGELDKTILLNESQREIWLSCLIGGDPANLAYNESVSLDLHGVFNFDYFNQAFQKVVQKHEALRSSLSANGEHLLIYKELTADLHFQDLSDKESSYQKTILDEFINIQMTTPFRLEDRPLFRAYVHQLGTDHHYFTLVIHHLIGDGWSIGIILEDISKLYNAYIKGQPTILSKGSQISGYALEQAAFLRSDLFKETEAYWLDLYKNNVPVLDLPIDFKRPSTRTYKAHRIDHPLPKELTDQLKATGNKAGSSFVNTLLSAFEVFLYHKSGQKDIIVGLPASGQSATGNLDLVGHCVNLLPIRSKIDPEISFHNYLKERKLAFFDAYDHQQFSFGQLVKELHLKRDVSRVPLVPVVFNIDMGMDNQVFFENIEYHLFSNPRAYETFEIFLNATGSRGIFSLEWTYNTQLFKASSIQSMSNEFEQLLKNVAALPELPLHAAMLSENMQNDSLVPVKNELHSDEKVSIPVNPVAGNINLIQQIYLAAEKYPEHIALDFEDQILNYKELMAKSDQLASYLIDQGVQSGDIIGLAVNRSLEMVISLLAILKSGAAYLPLDPEYPKDRIEFMLEDSSAKFIIISQEYYKKYKTGARPIVIEEIWNHLDTQKTFTQKYIGERDLVYVLYTSGSTGKPKGVKIMHKNLVNFLTSMQTAPGITPSDCLLAITTISFDIAGLELFLPLITGAKIVIASSESTKDGRLLLPLLERKGISILQATPSTLQMLIDSGWQKMYDLKVLSGGEPLSADLANQLLDRCTQLWNMYGPTETTIWSSIKRISSKDQTITIGLPINNTQIHILDEQGQQLPDESVGEIYIGGDGVAEGYLNRVELTKEKFTHLPGAKFNGTTFYRTGDLGKKLSNGEFLCLGRIDQQVKIRGHRIELGEIEAVISAQDGIKQAVVIAREDQPTDKKLTAYVLLEEKLTEQENLSWKERWDTLYNIGAEAHKDQNIAEQNLDDTLLEHYRNSSDLAVQSSEWLRSSVERIKALKSKNIYEIGSGAGQLLFELAPQTTYYLATDYAQTAIDKLNEKLLASPEKWKHIKAAAAEANDFSFASDQSFDLVLIHSVAQYFPGIEYLIDVIKKSAASIKDGGCIFIGDMQGKNSLEMCHAMDHLPNSADKNKLGTFKEVVLNRVRIEDELVADPGFFYNLPSIIPQISHVNIQLRKGQSLNETTKYHYDVWIYIETPLSEVQADITLDWQQKDSADGIATLLKNSSVVEVKNIFNARTAKDYQLLQLLHHADQELSLKDIKLKIEEANGGIYPDQIWKLAEENNYDAHIRWTTDGTDGLFNVVFIPTSLTNTIPQNPFKDNSASTSITKFVRQPYSKNEIPLSKETIQKWKEHLYKILPSYMVPEDFIALKNYPLTPNAKIDKNAFPKPQAQSKSLTPERNWRPKTSNEQLIADIWSELLGLEDIKVNDDFFEAGGHSLLAVKVMVAIEKETGKRLPLTTLFENSTIEKLARLLSKGEPVQNWDSLVPIKSTGTNPPIYMVHGGGLNVFIFTPLGKYMDKDQPLYGMQGLGLREGSKLVYTMEELADKYTAEILSNDPNGPYVLAGYSFGGLLAFEMAKKLLKMGKEIKMLGILDTYAGGRDRDDTKAGKFARKIIRQFRKIHFFGKAFLSNPKDTFDYQCIVLKRKLKNLLNFGKEVFENESNYDDEIYRSYEIAYNNYIMEAANVQVDLFRVKRRIYFLDDPIYMGWKEYAKAVVVHEVPGDHKTFLDAPNDEEFARIFQEVLNKKT